MSLSDKGMFLMSFSFLFRRTVLPGFGILKNALALTFNNGMALVSS